AKGRWCSESSQTAGRLGRWLLDELCEVEGFAQSGNQFELRFEVVNVVLLVGEDFFEQGCTRDVTDATHVLRALSKPSHRGDLELHVSLQLFEDGCTDRQ